MEQRIELEPSMHQRQESSKESSSPGGVSSDVRYRELRDAFGYWRSMHARAVEREERLRDEVARLKQQIAELKGENEKLEARLRRRDHQLFGPKTESKRDTREFQSGEEPGDKKRRRGQQPGGSGHGRRRHSHLPAEEVEFDLAADECRCSKCGLPFESFPTTEDSEQVEIEVRAYRRIIRRKRYKPTCACSCRPGLIAAPAPPKLIPKGLLGISVWVLVLLDKYLFQRPTYRLLESLKNYGLELAQGTLTDGMKRLAPLFEPIFHELLAKNLEEKHWHADETRWLVFQDIEGKEGHRWYLWVFASSSSVVYVLDPSRSSEVVKSHFGIDAQGIISADRYGAYKVLVKSGRFLIAFCWAHVRRDFLKVGKGYPEHGEWADEWVERIGKLYGLNQQRIAARAEQNAEAYAQANQELGSWLDEMAEARDAQLLDEPPEEKAKPLTSLTRHWSGLSLFLDHPEIPLDNNEAERLLRSSVVGRKNYYGSGSVWSGKLAAILFSIFQTLRRWRLNPRLWLISYLEACAQNRGEAPSDARRFLPWNMKEEERQALSIEVNDTS